RRARAGQRSVADPGRRADGESRFDERDGDFEPPEVAGDGLRQDCHHGQPRREGRGSVSDHVRHARRPVRRGRSSRMSAKTAKDAGLCAMVVTLVSTSAFAQSRPQYIPLGPAKGALYTPDTGPAPHVAVLVIHRTANFMSHIATTELAK